MSGARNTKRSPSSAAVDREMAAFAAQEPLSGGHFEVRPAGALHQHERAEDEHERERVDRVHPPHALRGNHEPAERRARDRGGLDRDRVQTDRVGQHVARHEGRQERLSRGQVERPGGRTARGQHVDRPHRREPAQRQHGQDGGEDRHQRLRDHHQPAAVERVGRHAADQRKEENRADAHEPDQPECERAAIVGNEQRHVPEHGRRLHEAAGEGQQQAPPEQAEVTVSKGGEHADSMIA